MLRAHPLVLVLVLALPTAALAERPAAVKRSEEDRRITPRAAPQPEAAPAPSAPIVPSRKMETRGGTLRKKVEAGSIGARELSKLPFDVSVAVTRPTHPRDPARITARRQGEPTFYQVKMAVRITLTCGPQMVVEVEPSSYARPRTVFNAFEETAEKTVEILPDEGGEWQSPPDCFYSITARVDPEHHIPEPNEHDNAATVYYSSP